MATLGLLLKSRKFMTAVVAIIASIVLVLTGDERLSEIVVLIGAFATSIILGIAVEDYGKHLSGIKQAKDVVDDLFDEDEDGAEENPDPVSNNSQV